MKTNLFNARKRGVAGPGGWTCACCGPSPKNRKKYARLYKKRTYRLLNKFENQDSQETSPE